MGKRYKDFEVDDQLFYKMPKSLFNNPMYKGLSIEAKAIYTILRDRMRLSKDNGWTNEERDIFLLFSRADLAEIVECSIDTITKAMKQLIKFELVEEKRQGLGKPNLIFICHIKLDDTKKPPRTPKNKESFRFRKNRNQDSANIGTNKTELSENEKNANEQGFVSGETKTVLSPNMKNVLTMRKIFDDCYEEFYGKRYQKHTPKKNREIDDALLMFFAEYPVGADGMKEMVLAYFNNVDCNHSLPHFVSGDILMNRFYESGCY